MTDQFILEKLTENNHILDNVTKRLDSLQSLFDHTPKEYIKPEPDGFLLSDSIEAHTVYQSEDVSVTKGIWHKEGDVWPEHCHKDSVEYVIVTHGTFLLKIEGMPRIMRKGECASIGLGVRHSVTAIDGESRMLGICIPPEKCYLVDKITFFGNV